MTREQIHLKARQSISIESAKQLAITTNTPPQMASLTPRWLLRFLPWVDVETGIYRVNQVRYLSEIQKLELSPAEEVTPSILRMIYVFSHLSNELLEEILNGMQEKSIKMGDVVIKKGDKDHQFYIILSGEFDVTVPGRHNEKLVVKTLTGGDYFGEMALLEDIPRQATVTAATDGRVLYLDKKHFDKIVKNPEIQKRIQESVEQRKKELQMVNQYGEVQAPLISDYTGEPPIPRGYVDYTMAPKELNLSIIQTIIGLHTKVGEIYNVPYDQLEQQLRITIENIREREEWELINNRDFGLLHNVVSNMVIPTRQGPPTPDDLDDLLALVWKKPSFFLAHPVAIAAFGRECTYRGVPPPTVDLFGTQFITWRGIPLIPSDKLSLNNGMQIQTTDIILMRVGEENQGVVGLHKATIGSTRVPSLSVQFMGINEKSIASYLLTKFFSLAVLVPDAIGVLTNVEVGSYHKYE